MIQLFTTTRFGLSILASALMVSGCASTEPNTASIAADSPQQAESCGRVEAAAEFSMGFFATMDDMAEACANGDVFACNPANYPLMAIAGVFFAPMGFLIGLASQDVEDHVCG
ncbi:MAG TPA: hypothetical protein VGB88_01605 [Alphaproteobacteria bacterium]